MKETFQINIENQKKIEYLSFSEDKVKVLERQEIYKKIKSEIENIFISEKDRDKEGNLLAPNGKKSNLPEIEWKMVRTSSFIKFFGDWRKYNKEDYNLWLKFQKKKSIEDLIYKLQKEKLYYTEYFYKKEYLKTINYNIIILSHKISKLQSELINSNFNINNYDLNYTKVLDENGEPLLLYRGTSFHPYENGKFVIHNNKYNGKDFKVGVFFGNEKEAKYHNEANKKQDKSSKVYKVFLNSRNFKIFNSKPKYWNDPDGIQDLQERYDGIWVKRNENEEICSDNKINIFDFVIFNPDNILIVDIK